MQYSNVPCKEREFTRQENRSLEAWNPTVQVTCTLANTQPLIDDLLNNVRPWPHASGLVVPRATAVTAVPIHDIAQTDPASSQIMNYEESLVTINYSIIGFDFGNGTPNNDPNRPYTAFAEVISPYVEYRNEDHNLLRWEDGTAVQPEETSAVQLHRMKISRQYFDWQGTVPAIVLSAQGKCNENTRSSDLLGLDFAPETVLFSPGDIDRTIQSDFTGRLNLRLQFIYKEEGWNKFWRTKTQSYQGMTIYDADTGTNEPHNPYPTADLSGVFV